MMRTVKSNNCGTLLEFLLTATRTRMTTGVTYTSLCVIFNSDVNYAETHCDKQRCEEQPTENQSGCAVCLKTK